MENLLLNLETEAHSFMETVLKSIVHEVSGVFRNRTGDSDKPIEDKLRRISQVLARRVVIKITSVDHGFGTEIAQTKQENELHCFMEVLLRSFVYEVSEVFRNRTSDSEDGFQDKLRGVSQILVRRAVFKITQCVEDSFGSEMAQMKEENESLKVRLQFWEKEPGAGGDRGQTDRVGHTLPWEIAAEIKEETELSELPAAEGKETLGEQHTESRQRQPVPTMNIEPERETPGPLLTGDLAGQFINVSLKEIARSFNELGSVSVLGHREEQLNELDGFSLGELKKEPQLTDPAEQQTDVPGEGNSTESQHPEESQDREGQEQHLQRMMIIRPCSVQVERLSLQSLKGEEGWGSSLMQQTELTGAQGKETLGEQHTESRQRQTVPAMNMEPERETPGPLITGDLAGQFINVSLKEIARSFNELGSVSVLGHREEQLNELDGFSLGELKKEPQLTDPAEQQTDVPGEGNSTESQHPEESQDREEQQQHLQRMMIIRPCSVQVERLSLQSLKGEEGWGSSLMQQTDLTGAQGKETLGEQHTESRQRQTVPAMNMEPERETPGPLITGDFAGQFINVPTKENAKRFNDLDSVSPRGPQENELAVSNAVDERPRATPTGGHKGENAGPFGGTEQDRHGERSQSEKPQEPQRSQGSPLKPGSDGVNKNSLQQIPRLCQSNNSKEHQHLHAGERPFICGQCGTSFICSSDLKTHQLMHAGEKQFNSGQLRTCSQCEKSFSTPNLLRSHQCVHAGERPFGCSECGKSYNCLKALKRHERCHTEERPFVCSQCGKSFKVLGALKSHELRHATERRFICSQCGKAFHCLENLRRHEHLHPGGERAFVCSKCGKSFHYSGNLKTHERRHAEDGPLNCSQCGKSFNCLKALKQHERRHTEERPFVCSQCGKSFKVLGALKRHELRHATERRFICSQCGKAYHCLENLRRHKCLHPAGERAFVCSQCGKSFKTSENLKTHERRHAEDGPLNCSQCGKSFNCLKTLKQHERRHTEERPFVCSQCGKAFKTSGSLEAHERRHAELNCSQCDKSFNCLKSLKQHKRCHTEERPFVCSQCGKSFKVLGALKRHELRHATERRFICSQCGKAYHCLENLRRHERLHTRRERSFVCSQCGKAFKTSGSLRTHQRLHTGEKPFGCIACGKSFSCSSTLKKHLRTHTGTGERPFSCSACGKSFRTPGDLKVHQRLHTGERPFSCSQCGRSFTRLEHLKSHQRIHTGERPFSCGQCGKRFTRSSSLKMHLRIHSGEKPFSCSQCGKSFTTPIQLKYHERIHTDEKPFSCSECGKAFRYKISLTRHQHIHTSESFSCSRCEKAFSTSEKLKRHQVLHRGYICSQCGKRFTQPAHLKAHQLIHAGEKPFGFSQCGKRFRAKSNLGRHQSVHKKRDRSSGKRIR